MGPPFFFGGGGDFLTKGINKLFKAFLKNHLTRKAETFAETSSGSVHPMLVPSRASGKWGTQRGWSKSFVQEKREIFENLPHKIHSSKKAETDVKASLDSVD